MLMLWLVFLIIAIAFFFVRQKQKQRTRDRKDELITADSLKDVYDNDLLDEEVGLMFT